MKTALLIQHSVNWDNVINKLCHLKKFAITRTCLSAYETKFFIVLFERAFKMMKNGVLFIVIALLVAELFKILIDTN